MKRQHGFTLVELAVVLTIVALLIGGVLKGQELLENSRMNGGWMKIKAAEAAARAFRDKFTDLPGDIQNPSGRLPRCTTSPCSVGGDGNTWVGWVSGQSATTYSSTSENNTFWVHLSVAGFLPDLPPADASGFYYYNTGFGSSGGFLQVQSWPYEWSTMNWWYNGYRRPASGPGADIPTNQLGRFDNKYDDGRPFAGDIIINSVCGTLTGASTAYDPNDVSISCLQQIRAKY